MEPSHEIRDLLFGMYHDFSVGDLCPRPHLRGRRRLGIGTDPQEWVVGGRALREVLRDMIPKQAGMRIPGDVQAFVEGTVGWVSDNPTS